MITQANYIEYNTPQFRRLSDTQLERLHHASLEILDRTGVILYDQEALDLMKRAGVKPDEENRVHIPPGLVEWALSVVPKRVVLCDRSGRRVMPLERNNVFFGPGSDCSWVVDHRTGEHRKGSLDFVREGTRVCDALSNIDFVMSMCMAHEIEDQRLVDRLQMRAMLMNTTKPIIHVPIELDGCIADVEMAEAVAGGEEALRRNPNSLCYINVAHPLRHNAESLQRLLYMAGKGLPSIYCCVVMAGASGPVTLAGGLALANAGELVGVVLSQLKRQGAPIVISGGYNNTFGMRSNGSGGGESPTLRGARPEMAHYYKLPAFGLGGASSSRVPDEQAMAEASLTLLTEAMSGNNIIHDVGYLGAGNCYSLEQLVMCDEMINWVRRFMQGIEINEETLALDLIDSVGPHGQYLDAEHTLRHYREHWYPKLLDQRRFEDWTPGSPTFRQRARQRIDQISTSHHPEPLPAHAQSRLDEIVARPIA